MSLVREEGYKIEIGPIKNAREDAYVGYWVHLIDLLSGASYIGAGTTESEAIECAQAKYVAKTTGE